MKNTRLAGCGIALVAAALLGGCVAPGPGYGAYGEYPSGTYYPDNGYYPGYYPGTVYGPPVAPSVSVGVGGYWGGPGYNQGYGPGYGPRPPGGGGWRGTPRPQGIVVPSPGVAPGRAGPPGVRAIDLPGGRVAPAPGSQVVPLPGGNPGARMRDGG